jgi:threonine dehydrogenase-like Zn-dependent dehydrogenase
MGAASTLLIARGGGQAEHIRAVTAGGIGADVCIDCTGHPAVWSDTMQSLRPGGLALLFGGCAPGTSVEMDTHHVHYSEITVKGVYHHRPETVRRRGAPHRRSRTGTARHDRQGGAQSRHPIRKIEGQYTYFIHANR